MNPLHMKHSVDKGTPGCGEAWTPKPRMPFSRSEGQGNYDIRIKRSGSLLGDEGEPPGEHSHRLSAKEAVCVIQGQGGLFTDSKRCARVLDSGRSDEQPWDPGRPGTSASDRKRVISRKLIISAPLLPTVAAVLSTLGRSESVGIECRMDPMWVGPGDDTPKSCAIQPQFSHYPCIQSIRKREKGSNILSSSPPPPPAAAAAAGASAVSGASAGTATVAVTDHFPHQASIGCSVDRNDDQKIGKVAKPRPLVSSSASSLVLDNPGSPYILAEILSYLSVRERHSSAMLVSHLWSSTSALRAVKHLRLNGLYNITDDDAHRIADQYTSLQSVSLNRCCRIGDSALAAFARAHGDTLSEVDVGGCPGLTDKSMASLAQCAQLRTLRVYGCHRVSHGAVRRLQDTCPGFIPPIPVPRLVRQMGVYRARRPPAMMLLPTLGTSTKMSSKTNSFPDLSKSQKQEHHNWVDLPNDG